MLLQKRDDRVSMADKKRIDLTSNLLKHWRGRFLEFDVPEECIVFVDNILETLLCMAKKRLDMSPIHIISPIASEIVQRLELCDDLKLALKSISIRAMYTGAFRIPYEPITLNGWSEKETFCVCCQVGSREDAKCLWEEFGQGNSKKRKKIVESI